MLQSKARWKISKTDEQKVEELVKQLNLSKIASRFLVQRGFSDIKSANEFLHLDPSSIHDPFLLKDMDIAISRIKEGIAKGENILVFGDYDADGVTSTSLLYLTLRQLGANVGYYVPNRFTEGYGPNEQAFRHAKEEDVSLIITVDTGIAAVHEAEVAKELGIDLIITDHHEAPPVIPDAYAVVNPKQPDCTYPNPNLAGVGVAFKVAHGLLGRYPEEYIDLVAIGTIADLVPLKGENRFLAATGIQSLPRQQRPGIKALLEQCGIQTQEMSEEQIGFMIGPRLNAAGRLDSADPAIQLLICEDEMEAYELALIIDDLNNERKSIVNEMTKEAERQVNDFDEIPPVLVVGQAGWNAGVIGIVASRLVEKYYRPTIVLSIDHETGLAKGSARSIAGFDMFQSLSQCREWLPHFGGHPMAAGLTMKVEHVELMHQRMNEIATKTVLPEDWQQSISIDLPISLDEVTTDAIRDLQNMAPFGIGNPAPKVLLENLNIGSLKKIGAKEDHLKLILKNESSQLDSIAFKMGPLYDEISPLAKISVVGHLSINEWNGHIKPQIIIEDLRIGEWQLFDLRGEKEPWKIMTSLSPTDVALVAFRKESTTLFSKFPSNWTKLTFDEIETHARPYISNKSLLLLDLPTSFDELKHLFSLVDAPNRIYASFSHEQDNFFETLPSRDHFKWFYAFMLKRKSFDLTKHARDLEKHKGWTKNAVHFICKVFFDLEFVKIYNGIVTIVENPAKKDLMESETYRQRIEQNEIENELFYSSVSELKRYFSSIMEEKELMHQ